MRPIRTFHVQPKLPEALSPLLRLAMNLRWSWDLETIDLFRRLERDLWERAGHNPLLLLGQVTQARLEEAAQDEGFLSHMARVLDALDRYLKEPAWYQGSCYRRKDVAIAYFSAEFGLTECLPIYSGGLGILSGDHLKSASDIGLPLVGVGLLYQKGYFRQYLTSDGWQQERFPDNDFFTMPIEPIRKDDGAPLLVPIPFPGRMVYAQVWRIQVGRVPLYLLDTNVPGNAREDQDITDELYGGDLETRIKQEIVLGIGGIRALAAIGICPAVCHMNEGHSAFLALERIRMIMQKSSVPFRVAREVAVAGHVFTTHTPVPAGIDVFPPALMDRYFGDYARDLGLSRAEFLGLGRIRPADENEGFCMAVLALRLAARTNGVSALHGEVSRGMWQALWPGVPFDEIPIGSVTNGIHARSWVSQDMATLYDRYLGPRWHEDPTDPAVWNRIDQIPAEEIWRTHERRRERLIAFARKRLRSQLEARGSAPAEIEAADEVLDPRALTIGFGRRFATYKRATLLLRDPARLRRILLDPERPVQVIFAGKAHPRDNPGKELIRQIVHVARGEDLRRRIVFLEDYDMCVARYLVQGVDIWLNTPRRPREASGTSGMKAALNGVINVSVLDGWWAEGYRPETGWAIGRGEDYRDEEYQDIVESSALYELLERDIVPLFYTRDRVGIPRGWLAKMKGSIRTLGPVFTTTRMVHQYACDYYMTAAERAAALGSDGLRRARTLAQWRDRVTSAWGNVRILSVDADAPPNPGVGDPITVETSVALGLLLPDDVAVELYVGTVHPDGEIGRGRAIPMAPAGGDGKAGHRFRGEITYGSSGLHGFTIRILPRHSDLTTPFDLRCLTWA